MFPKNGNAMFHTTSSWSDNDKTMLKLMTRRLHSDFSKAYVPKFEGHGIIRSRSVGDL